MAEKLLGMEYQRNRSFNLWLSVFADVRCACNMDAVSRLEVGGGFVESVVSRLED